MNSKQRQKRTSVAGFLFMPQLGLSFQHFSHLIPVFMRTMALIFAQAGLIAENHPATRYGMEGVKKYGLRAMLGEAWVTLRTTPHSPQKPYQWSLFLSIIMMISFVIGSAIAAIMTVAFGLGTAAQAQIFGLQGIQTDSASVPDAGGQQGLFDKRIYALGSDGAGGEGSSDYGIMVLDKLLRQGMMDRGGALQNGLRDMFEVYNNGVLIVAGVMMFWGVITIVIDTAKTGVFGGNRHNMVWTPIRIVFALALLIPLAEGFSTGQFMVVKFAEWGSNLGSNAWKSYIRTVLTDNTEMIRVQRVANPTQMVYRYVNMWVCRVSYNVLTWQANNEQLPISPREEIRHVFAPLTGTTSDWGYAFTNDDSGNICGHVSIPAIENDQRLRAVAGTSNGDLPATPNRAAGGNMPEDLVDDVADAIVSMKVAMLNTQKEFFVRNDGGLFGVGAPGAWDPDAAGWACAFVAQHILPRDDGASPMILSQVCEGIPFGATNPDGSSSGGGNTVSLPISGDCGGNFGPGGGAFDKNNLQFPGQTCILRMIDQYASAMEAELETQVTAVDAMFRAVWFDDLNAADSPINRGWTDMGAWFTRLGMINAAVRDETYPQIAVVGGDLIRKINAVQQAKLEKGPDTEKDKLSDIEEDMLNINMSYENWWQLFANVAQSGQVAINNGVPIDPTTGTALGGAQPLMEQDPGTPDDTGFLDRLKVKYAFQNVANQDPEMVIGRISQKLTMHWAPFMMDIAQPDNPNTYPFAELSRIGSTLLKVALAGVLGTSGIAMAMDSSGGGLATGFFLPALGSIVSTLSASMVLAGLLLTYYVPMLPLLRTTFAVLTWMISVFEAVAMVPIAALAHLNTEGEGLVGGAKGVWVLWLNVLLRPVLTVAGFVASLMVFNTFVVYFHAVFKDAVMVNFSTTGFSGLFTMVAMTFIYVSTIYVIANSSFKLLDIIPAAMMRWLPGAQVDKSFDDTDVVAGMVNASGHMISSATRGINYGALARNTKEGAGATKGDDLPEPPPTPPTRTRII